MATPLLTLLAGYDPGLKQPTNSLLLWSCSQHSGRNVLQLYKSSMKPSMLIRHLDTKHPNHPKKSLEFFRRHEAGLKCQKLILPEVSTEKRGIVWSRTWNYQAKKTHTIGKTLVKPCLLKTIKIFLGEASKAKMKQISLPTTLFRGAFQMCRKMVKTRW